MSVKLGNTLIASNGSTPEDDLTISLNSDQQLQATGTINHNDTTEAVKFWKGTQAEWEAGRAEGTIPDTWICYIIDTDDSQTRNHPITLVSVSSSAPITTSVYKVTRNSDDPLVQAHPEDYYGYVSTSGSSGSTVANGSTIYEDKRLLCEKDTQSLPTTNWTANTDIYATRISYNGDTYESGRGVILPINQSTFATDEVIDTQWQSNHVYAVGDKVVYDNNYYKCAKIHTSGSTFSTTEPAPTNNWTANTKYYYGNLVVHNGQYYQCQENEVQQSSFALEESIPTYSTSTSYTVGDKANYNGTDLICNTDTSGTFDPDCWDYYFKTIYWRLYTLSTYWYHYQPINYWNQYVDQWEYAGESVSNTLKNGDQYYNTTTKKLYIYKDNEWVDNGVPEENALYIDKNMGKLYYYDGEELGRLT